MLLSTDLGPSESITITLGDGELFIITGIALAYASGTMGDVGLGINYNSRPLLMFEGATGPAGNSNVVLIQEFPLYPGDSIEAIETLGNPGVEFACTIFGYYRGLP